jgi:transcriptional regulator with XRE-family HTH domain
MRPIPPSPSTGPTRIGPRLRETRMAQGLTIGNLAEATGLTKGFISRVERDETSPSVATLVNLCQVLSLPVGASPRNTKSSNSRRPRSSTSEALASSSAC